MDPFWSPFRSEWASLGGPGDRNFDAGRARDLNFDPFSWFEPSFFGCQRTSKCEHSKKPDQSRSGSSKKFMLFNTSCFKNLPLTSGKVHIANMHFFWVKRTKKHREIEIRFLDPVAHFEEGRNFCSRYVSQNSRFPRVVCLCGAVGECGECH